MHYKFRAIKKSEPRRWVYGSLITSKNPVGSLFIEIDRPGSQDISRYEVIPETVGMFTGLSDKYNTEIYGGDNLAFIHQGRKAAAPIIWHGHGFGVTDRAGGYFIPKTRTVQGTIHDHFLNQEPE